MLRIFYLSIGSMLLLTACFNNHSSSTDKNDSTQIDSIIETNATTPDSLSLQTLSETILRVIKEKQYDSLATYFHPEKGVRFSPYAFIDTTEDIRLSADAFKAALKTGKAYHWGAFDGTGEPINLNIEAYFNRFVYDVDFAHPEKFTINQSSSKGNTINNLESVYINHTYTESYFSGFEKKYEGMDWKALRLVYEKYKDRYYLIAVVHDQWTI